MTEEHVYIVWIDNNIYCNDESIYLITKDINKAEQAFMELYKKYINGGLTKDDIPCEENYPMIIDDDNTYIKLVKLLIE